MNKNEVLDSLNKILEHELAGVVKYTHYAFMVQGPYRLSVVQWLREQAQESLAHAEAVGEHVTSLGEHPTLKISDLLETHKHSTEDILNECFFNRYWLKNSLGISTNIPEPSPEFPSYAFAPLWVNLWSADKAEGSTFGSDLPLFVATQPTPHASWNFSGLNNGYFLFCFFK